MEAKNNKDEILIRNVVVQSGKRQLPSSGIIIEMKTKDQRLKHGMKVEIKGELSSFSEGRNPGDFNEHFYSYINKIDYKCKNPEFISCSPDYNFLKESLYRFKLRLKDNSFKSDYSENRWVSAMLNTMLLSDKSELDPKIKELYQKNGISHILAISGLHIWTIGGGLYHILRKLGTGVKKASVISMSVLSFYILLIGFGISSFRAYIMLILYFVSLLLKRTYHILTACSFAMILSLMINYRYVLHPSFLLSYSAVYSIILVFPMVSEIIHNKFLNKSGFSLSLSLQLSMLPVIASLFYEIPVYALFLNMLIIPLVLPILILGILSYITGFISFFLSSFFLFLSEIILDGIHWICEMIVNLPYSVYCIGKPDKSLILIYYILLFLLLLTIRYLKYRRTVFTIGIFVLLFILNFKTRADLVISMLDIGQGDAIVLETKNEGVVMIDGGSTTLADGGKKRIENFLKYKGYQSIRLHILTHSDKDHLNGIRNMMKENYSIGQFFLPGISIKDSEYREFENLISQEKRIYIEKGDRIVLGDIEIECLHPYHEFGYTKCNEYSTVLYLKYKDFDMLFTGDLEGKGEEELERMKLPDIDVLKVAHHGSKNSTYESFLEKVRPEYAVISCGLKNPYGHPHNNLMKRLQDQGISVYRTDQNGEIEIRTNGRNMLIRPYLSK